MLRESLLAAFAVCAPTDIALLPGVRPPGDTVDLVPDSVTEGSSATNAGPTTRTAGSGMLVLATATITPTVSSRVVATLTGAVYVSTLPPGVLSFQGTLVLRITDGTSTVFSLSYGETDIAQSFSMTNGLDVAAGATVTITAELTPGAGGSGVDAISQDIRIEAREFKR